MPNDPIDVAVVDGNPHVRDRPAGTKDARNGASSREERSRSHPRPVASCKSLTSRGYSGKNAQLFIGVNPSERAGSVGG